MPVYTFLNKKTNEEFTEMMTISDMEKFLKDNPDITQVFNSLNIIGGVQGISHKTDGGWKDNLSRIAEAHPNSPLADRYGKKSIKEVKTRQVIEKHKKRLKGK